MTNKAYYSDLLQLNLAVLLVSTSGVLGRYIDLPVITIIFGRAIVGSIFIYLFCRWSKIKLSIAKGDRGYLILAGIFLGAHWISYFISLKLSSVAIAMLSLYCFPIITTFLEPFFLKTRLHFRHILLGVLIIIGIYLLIPIEDAMESNTLSAIAWGLFSGIVYSLRNIIMKKQVANYHGSTLMFYQLCIISFILLFIFPFYNNSNIESQWPFILVLGVVTTAIGHTMFLYSFKRLSATTASLLSSIQPVFGILLALLFLGEIPSLLTIIGGIIILGTVVIESVWSSRSKKT